VAKWGKSFDMNVIGFDPSLPPASFKELGIKRVDLDKVWPAADFITVHTPLTPDTRNLINAETLAKCKTGVHIVNCARGGIINEEDLLAALESGKVGGAALDVYEKEPPAEKTRKLLDHPNVVCTPHLGASTEEAQINVARDIAIQMCDTLEGKDYVGVVNVSYMGIARNPAIKPYADLAQLLGSVAGQFKITGHGTVKTLKLSSWGSADISITTPPARALLMSRALVGLLKSLDTKGVVPGIVNAPNLAGECNVEFEVSTSNPPLAGKASPYRNLITVEATAKNGSHISVTGSVFGNEPCIVSMDNYKSFPALKIDEGSILKFRNTDRPGAISGVLDVLEQARVNVGNLTLGRQEGDLALCLLTVDGAVPKEVLSKLNSMESLTDVRSATI